MARHPSLKIKDTDLQHRNVLKRFERITMFLKKSGEESLTVFKLPKFKRKRVKGLEKEVKKEEASVENVSDVQSKEETGGGKA
ncbi:MAG: hypothetical protein P9M06_06800 [Candidatus Saelkia tenebricola]|nr:hypothetical protein [Candidatus Saelkia tenebricola]